MRTRLAIAFIAALALPALAQNTTPNSKPANNQTKQAQPSKTQNTGGNSNNNSGQNLDAWREHNRPGAQHLKLSSAMSGVWQTTTTYRTEPTGTPVVSTGTAQVSPTLNGRFILQEVVGKMGDQEFRGMGFFGFNNATKQFESFWVDNESTGMLSCTGKEQADGSIVWTGAYADPITGQNKSSKSITRFPGKDNWVFEMYDTTSDGREFLSLKVEYNRTGHTPALELRPIEPGNQTRPATNTPGSRTGQKPESTTPSTPR